MRLRKRLTGIFMNARPIQLKGSDALIVIVFYFFCVQA